MGSHGISLECFDLGKKNCGNWKILGERLKKTWKLSMKLNGKLKINK